MILAVRDGSIRTSGKPLLHALNFEIRRGSVTAILGPAGSGKSRLLEALRDTLAAPWRRDGEWHQCETATIVAVRQPLGGAAVDWRGAFGDSRAVVMLDETDRAATGPVRYELASLIRAQTREGAVVLVTHD
ncbi:MAG TPA: ATP-binding cassette domain-containing protein, partial [Thermoanaerobaculia bacterium]